LIFGLEFTILNKFEKERKVIELHSKEGKTLKEIAKIVKMSFRDISKIIKVYERKITLQAKRKENNQNGQIKKPLISTKAYKLFSDGKKLTDVAIDLEIPAKKAVRLWSQFLRLERMYDYYEFYQFFQYQIPELLAIGSFIRKNQVDITNIANVLKNAKDVFHLQSYRSEIKNEIERLKQTKSNYTLNQNMQPVPLGPLPRYYNW
jgi:hypothetical protein